MGMREVVCGAAVGGIVLGVRSYGQGSWNKRTGRLRDAISLDPPRSAPRRHAHLADVPAPVRAYLTSAVRDGMQPIASASAKQNGAINLGSSSPKWRPFHATTTVNTHLHSFLWDARVAIFPGLAVHVHDGIENGRGFMRAAVAGIAPVADEASDELLVAELYRYWAEAVFYPTLLWPARNVRWEHMTDDSSVLHATAHGVSVSLLFTFGERGLPTRVEADARPRIDGDTVSHEKWRVDYGNYKNVQGLWLPQFGQASWVSSTGPLPYYRAESTMVAPSFGQRILLPA